MKIGHFKIDFINVGLYLVDGGCMFGTTPRIEWEKKFPPDGNNCILLRIRCMLVRGGDRVILVDTGAGELENDRYYRTKGIQPPQEDLAAQLKKLGVSSDDVTDVINTHLHTVNSGGNLRRSPKGKIIPAFPKASYWIQKEECGQAGNDSDLLQDHYSKEAVKALEHSGKVKWLSGDKTICDGISVSVTGSHTGHDQTVTVSGSGETLVFLGGFIPTAAHVEPQVISGFDLYPAKAFEQKSAFLETAGKKKWILGFQYDPSCYTATVHKKDGAFSVKCLKSDMIEHLIF